jgi:hypothetical protein
MSGSCFHLLCQTCMGMPPCAPLDSYARPGCDRGARPEARPYKLDWFHAFCGGLELLTPERDHRVHLRSSAGWHETGSQSNSHEHGA